MFTIAGMMRRAFQTSVAHGWWPMTNGGIDENDVGFTFTDGPRVNLGAVNIPEKLALMHEEISEALGEYRAGKKLAMYCPECDNFTPGYTEGNHALHKPEGLVVELADCVIRIMDFSQAFELDLEAALDAKLEYNKTRPYRHGNKLA